MKNLEILHLTNNTIKTLPNEITNLSNLRKLYLANNQIEELPPSFGNMTNLQSLDLRSGYRYFNWASIFERIAHLPQKLEVLYLSYFSELDTTPELSKLNNKTKILYIYHGHGISYWDRSSYKTVKEKIMATLPNVQIHFK